MPRAASESISAPDETLVDIIQILRSKWTFEKVLFPAYFNYLKITTFMLSLSKLSHYNHLNSCLSYLQWDPLLILLKLLQITRMLNKFSYLKTSFLPKLSSLLNIYTFATFPGT